MVLMLGLLVFLFGLKHSYDADHLIAVSNFLTRTKSLRRIIQMSLSWSVGHTLTATLVTIILFHLKESYLSFVFGWFEFAAAIMMLIIGAFTLKRFFVFHKHSHTHGDKIHAHLHFHLRGRDDEHYHKHLFSIGIVHGLASNDELLLLFSVILNITTISGILLAVSVFSAGVVVGMVAYGLFFGLPFLRFGKDRIKTAINMLAGCLSIGYGAVLIAELI